MEIIIYIILGYLVIQALIWLFTNIIGPAAKWILIVAVTAGVLSGAWVAFSSYIKSIIANINPYPYYVDKSKNKQEFAKHKSYFFGPGLAQLGKTIKDAWGGIVVALKKIADIRDNIGDWSDGFLRFIGYPAEGSRIREAMQRLIKENNLPAVVFHSLRHSSITYKLKLNGGDIKAVQGDSGHAQATMVTEQYSHILDEGRQANAQLIEEAFYGGKGAEKLPAKEPEKNPITEQAAAAGVDPAELVKILSNPAMVNLLKSLSQTMGAT